MTHLEMYELRIEPALSAVFGFGYRNFVAYECGKEEGLKPSTRSVKPQTGGISYGSRGICGLENEAKMDFWN